MPIEIVLFSLWFHNSPLSFLHFHRYSVDLLTHEMDVFTPSISSIKEFLLFISRIISKLSDSIISFMDEYWVGEHCSNESTHQYMTFFSSDFSVPFSIDCWLERRR
ncbi:hypothetical protein PFISCL1PPCAC_1619, partial [Pristionchus fissidentatus]